MWLRLSAALSLFLLAPLIAEYLSGSLSMAMIVIVWLMAFMYGSGALLIREAVRRTGRGWPSIVLLAAAYGLIEEGLVDQSLFNPNYLHLRLLDFGYVPALGIGLPWTIYVISIHVIWSICTPIGLTEALFRRVRDRPWLGPVSASVFALLYLAGSGAVFSYTYKSSSFMASPAQLGVTALIVVLLMACAFLWPKKKTHASDHRASPNALILFALSFGMGSLFALVEDLGPQRLHWNWQVCCAALVGLEVAFCLLLALMMKGKSWSNAHSFALVAGSLLVYICQGFWTAGILHGASELPLHALLAAGFLGLTLWAGIQTLRPLPLK